MSWSVLPAPAQAAPSVDTPVATTQLNYTKPVDVHYYWAGVSGFEYFLGPLANPRWLDYPGVTPPEHAGPDDLATGADVAATAATGDTITLKHRSTGVTASVTFPAGQTGARSIGPCRRRPHGRART